MKITMLKLLLALAGTGYVLLGVTLAAETNKRQPQARSAPGRTKRGLLSALFGGGGATETTPAAEATPSVEVLPIYGDPAQPPLHLLYGHSMGLPGPVPPYPVMFIPAPPNEDHRSGAYLPVLAYGGLGGPVPFPPPAAMDSNYLPAGFTPTEPTTTTTTTKTTTTMAGTTAGGKSQQPTSVEASKSAYLQQLNLSPADEAELKRLSKQLGVTDFEHLPPFEDVMALLGTTTAAETIQAIKEYAATPDGLELIRDYVQSYQPAVRVSLGKQPYTDTNALGEGSAQDDVPSTPTPAAEPGFFAYHLRRLKSLLTFGYFGGDDMTPTTTSEPGTEASAPAEDPVSFVRQDGRLPERPMTVAHYLVPVRALQHLPSYPTDYRHASTLPFPLALHYPPEGQYPNPFAGSSLPETVSPPQQPVTVTTAKESTEPTVAPRRVAPPTLATGEVHTFERADLEQPTVVRTTTTVPGDGGTVPEPELVTSSTSSAVPEAEGQREPLKPIIVAADASELATNALGER